MSKKLYCIAQFRAKNGKNEELFETLKALEPNTLREDGCLQYIVTKNTTNTDVQFPLAFNEIWADKASFDAHCAKKEIVDFFQTHCVDEDGLVEEYLVQTYSDEL